MKLEELRNAPEGTKLLWSQGDGWWKKVTFNRLVKVTKFPKMTFSEFMANGIDMSKGKDTFEAYVTDDRGNTHIISARRLRRDYE